MQSIYDIPVTTITGEETTLRPYEGKVLLIVNVASKCGFTKQYDGLQKLYEKYKDEGFYILGFPSNDFKNQEPGTNEEILEFCRVNFGVTFPLFSKISVKRGEKQHPLYTFLTSKETNKNVAGRITWNFNKFLISRDGTVITRFGSRTEPLAPKVIKAIEEALKGQ
ncbi:Glutathione peroxidase family protein [Chitinispirillum alkaliphilum]|nr:Glutathione peroxidase family protein [Chitinispirillum alkaliphilum]